MRKVVYFVYVLATMLAIGQSESVPKEKDLSKECPKIEEFVDINFDKYMSKKWYCIYRPSELDHELCTTYKYDMDKDDDGKLKPFLKKTISYKSNSTASTCYDYDDIQLAILSSNDFKGTVFAYEDHHSYNYTVIATDYESYSIEYRCEDGEGPQVWVHSNESDLSSENEKLVQHSLKLRGLPSLEALNKLVHGSECAVPEQKCAKKKIK